MGAWFAQEFSSSCISACVRIALTKVGVTASEEQVRRLLRHNKYDFLPVVAQSRLPIRRHSSPINKWCRTLIDHFLVEG